MNINVVCVGKLKERYWTEACAEYLKRLSSYCSVKVTELREAKQQGAGAAAEALVVEQEGKAILEKIGERDYVIALAVKGKRLSSEGLADKINALALEGRSDVCFVIGGSLGLSTEVMKRADYSLSFSDMTFPHQMMRVILLEQIYRSFKIIRGETYHKWPAAAVSDDRIPFGQVYIAHQYTQVRVIVGVLFFFLGVEQA
ncbi:MAG: 23S rRNA (pseudouridine(1915)-N(3))-methyltransferase RlmH [Firmicutes bacterium]|nr:23S rRNA (pseudouridine(1915)-N(3))-methyltransferase RlmH [Bacillota bacterium]